jgi:hypothetical protein
MTQRLRDYLGRAILIGPLLLLSWLGMMVVHEAGHILHAWLSGGTIRQVVLHPLTISRTELLRNPHPQFVAWGGIVWGTMLPLSAFFMSHLLGLSATHLVRFFAAFCCVSNGAYFVVATIDRCADAGDLVNAGAPAWIVGLVGASLFLLGLRLWHGQSSAFGFGLQKSTTSPGQCAVIIALLVLLVCSELLANGRLYVLE